MTPGMGMPGMGTYNHGDREDPIDEETGLQWIHKAVELGHAEAQYMLGNRYNGVWQGGNIPRDDAEMKKWYRKAAEQGYAPAQEQLGQLYLRRFFEKLFEGKGEVSIEEAMANVSEEDKAEGLKWLRMAKASGKRIVMKDANQYLQQFGEE
jgi:TPR repeat protein